MSETISILYVDDSRLDRELVRDTLEQDGGFALVEARTREEFERRLLEGPYELVLSDFNILGFEGLAVLDAVREHMGDVPVIIVTGTGSEEIAVETMKRGAADYVLKTVAHIKRLPQTIRRALEQHRLLADKREREERRRAVAQVRDAIWQMRFARDIHQVVDAVRRGLENVGVNFAECGINIVEESEGADVRVYSMLADGKGVEITEGIVSDVIVDMWKKSGVHYRPNLQVDDLYREKEHIAEAFAFPVNSIVDIAFAQGTLAVNSERVDAFSERDIEAIEEMTQALEEGFRRQEDLRRLEETNEHLQLEIAERRAMEKQLLHSERLRVLGEMAAGVSHNLNNILTGVLAPAQLLKRGIDDPERAEQALDDIFVSGQRAADLVKRLGRSVHGDHEEILRSVEVNRVIEEVVQATRSRWQDEGQSRGVDIELDLHLGEVGLIKGSESGLHDMLVNLIFNAVDAMPSGGRISVNTALSGAFVSVEVGDTGTGMDAQTCQRVFEPFFTTKAGVGTGLGLATLYGTVRRWGGMVSVDSEPGKGAVFTLRLPMWRDRGTASDKEVLSGDAALVAARILVVEDDPIVRSVLKRSLEMVRQVDAVENGVEALELFEPGHYDAALIDLSLPGIPGDQLALQMKRIDPDVTLVLMTGWILEESDHRRSPFDYCLQKPFVPQELRQIIDRAIGC